MRTYRITEKEIEGMKPVARRKSIQSSHGA